MSIQQKKGEPRLSLFLLNTHCAIAIQLLGISEQLLLMGNLSKCQPVGISDRFAWMLGYRTAEGVAWAVFFLLAFLGKIW